ncbi:MAG TPA: carboxypeptidase-like regulatory domain-containing protein, partial [Planctomycetota bacterium]|nr:carboxypeptidase-like regulatory domain-containing protein [Planctomycetota bacterium]
AQPDAQPEPPRAEPGAQRPLPEPIEAFARGDEPAADAPAANGRQRFELAMPPVIRTLRGRVVDARGDPLAGVLVRAGTATTAEASSRTDRTGAFVLYAAFLVHESTAITVSESDRAMTTSCRFAAHEPDKELADLRLP